MAALGCDGIENPPVLVDSGIRNRVPDDARVRVMDLGRDILCPGGEMAMGELCNGKDDDCDGNVDEGFANDCSRPNPCEDGDQRQCETQCGSGIQRCEAGDWAECEINRPNAEFCDDLDNDCDGSTDEGLICQELDAGNDGGFDLGVADAQVDMRLDPDAAPPPPPDMGPGPCRGNLSCEPGEFCLTGACVSAAPGTFVFTMLSARFDDTVGDPLGGDPDVYVQIDINGEEEARTEAVEGERAVQWQQVRDNSRQEIFLERNANIRLCVLDEDGAFKGGDDEMGCFQFTVADVVDIIRRYDGNRPGNSPHWALVTPTPPRNSALTEFRFSVERFYRR